jgi:hypothetical protein
MNGATAEPSARIIKAPRRTKKTTIGISHHFLLAFK